jgi:uroporphyrinogen-III synthase
VSLTGLRIVVTREPGKALATARALRDRGAVPVLFPVLGTAPPADSGPLDAAVSRLAAFDWVVVASANAVDAVLAACRRLGVPLAGPRWAAVGRATAAALRDAGVAEVLVPDRRDGDGLLAALLAAGAGTARVLIPRAERGRDVVIDGLLAAGARVEAVVAYRTVARVPPPAERDALLADPPAAVLFFSPSAVDAFRAALGDAAPAFLSAVPSVAIGPTTAAALAAAGVVAAVVPAAPERWLDSLDSAGLRRA